MSQERTIYFEIERLLNLIRGFGWVKTKETIVDDKIIITVEKSSLAAERLGTDDNPG